MEWQAGEHVARVPVGETTLDGNLTLPASPIGVVLFAHGTTLATNALITRRFPRARICSSIVALGVPIGLERLMCSIPG